MSACLEECRQVSPQALYQPTQSSCDKAHKIIKGVWLLHVSLRKQGAMKISLGNLVLDDSQFNVPSDTLFSDSVM